MVQPPLKKKKKTFVLFSGFRSPENKEPVPFCGLFYFIFLCLPLLAGRSGGDFVTGEPLIKFPLHPPDLLLEPGRTVLMVELMVWGGRSC